MTATTSEVVNPLRHFLRTALVALLTAAGLGLLGYYPSFAQGGAAGVAAMAVGLGVAVTGAWLGSLPPLLFVHKPASQFPAGILAGLFVRFMVTLGIGLGIWALDVFPPEPLLIWVGIGQVVILGMDTVGMVRLGREITGERR